MRYNLNTVCMDLRYFLLICLYLIIQGLDAQTEGQRALLIGIVTDLASYEPIELVNVFVVDQQLLAETDAKGNYQLYIPADQALKIQVERLGYEPLIYELEPTPAGKKRLLNFAMQSSELQQEIVVRSKRIMDGGLVEEQLQDIMFLPSVSGNLESALPSIALGMFGGTGGELTSQYNVRGGNYDENLVYINDFEIYRPQLVSNSQQEGLSFPNINLIQALSFSSGGFESKYGDKMSSVLDIKYKRPEAFGASIEASLLGASVHFEGAVKSKRTQKKKFTYLLGGRYKSNSLLLNTLDTKGEYDPDFTDFQAFLTYNFSEKLQLSYLGNYNNARYRFIPRDRQTTEGSLQFAIRLSALFQGQEVDRFQTSMNGLALTQVLSEKKHPIFLKWMAYTQQSNESEYFDLIAAYRLNEIDIGLGSETFGEEIATLGTGIEHRFTRDKLKTRISTLEHRGGVEINAKTDGNTNKSNFIQWGLRVQREDIKDRINEWEALDSAGFVLPAQQADIQLTSVYKSQNTLQSLRSSAFLQNTFTRIKPDQLEYQITVGLRGTYWDLNKQFNLSPRVQLKLQPLAWERDVSFRFSTGYYVQPPFYREMRLVNGTLNQEVKAQTSLHFVGGLSWNFLLPRISKEQFKWIVEAYYKKLNNLNAYDVDNVRIRYDGSNDATGYVMGIDMRLNGAFVPGAESWINLSLMRAREHLDGVQHQVYDANTESFKDVKDVKRPSDQWLTFSMFFQDYIPKMDRLRVHLNLIVGSGLPFGLPNNNRVVRNIFKYSAYRRMDIGFSWGIWKEDMRKTNPNNFFRGTKKAWLSLEVFNLLEISNEASKTWIKTITNEQFAISNNLTGRRLNLRFRVDF